VASRQLLVLAQYGRQLQLHEVMGEQYGGHGGGRAGRGRIGLDRHAAYGSQRSAGTLIAVSEPGAFLTSIRSMIDKTGAAFKSNQSRLPTSIELQYFFYSSVSYLASWHRTFWSNIIER
jgi:hypothetical protein